MKTPEEEREVASLGALALAISAGLHKTKRSGSNKKRAAFRAFKSNVKKSRAKKSLGSLVNLNDQSISKAIKICKEILKGDKETRLYIKHKVCKDALLEQDKKKIFNYWSSSASPTTGDKKD